MHLVRRSWVLLLAVLLAGCGSSDPVDREKPATENSVAATLRAELPAIAELPTRSDGAAVAYKYRMLCDYRRTATMPDGQQSVVREQIEYDYSWRWQSNEAQLVLHGIGFEMTADDQVALKSSMSRSERMIEQDGMKVDEAFADLNPQWQEVLSSSFDTPLCDLVIDEGGNQLQRTVTDRPGAKVVLERGIVANTQLFQGPFPADKKVWESTAEIAAPHYARGTLTYEAVDLQSDANDDLVEVHVSGTLAGSPEAEPTDVDNVVYNLEGTMLYSRRMQQWVAGSIGAELTFDTFVMQQKIANSGKATLTMSLVSSQTYKSGSPEIAE